MEEFLDDIRLDSQVVSSIKLPVQPSLGLELAFVRPALNSDFSNFIKYVHIKNAIHNM